MYARDVKSKIYGNEPLHLEKGTGDYFDFKVRECFGNKIRDYRTQLEFTREEFATDFNKEMNPEKPMNIHNITRWEAGEAFPVPRTLVALFVYFNSRKGIPCDFNDFLMFEGLERSSNFSSAAKLVNNMTTDRQYRLLTIPYSLLEYFDGKKVLLEIKNVLFPATVNLMRRCLFVKEDEKNYSVSFSKVNRLKVYLYMEQNEELLQSATILSLSEAKKLQHVYISWMDQSDSEFAKKISGYYSYVPTLKAFTNTKMDIHLNELDYLQTFFATTDFK